MKLTTLFSLLAAFLLCIFVSNASASVDLYEDVSYSETVVDVDAITIFSQDGVHLDTPFVLRRLSGLLLMDNFSKLFGKESAEVERIFAPPIEYKAESSNRPHV